MQLLTSVEKQDFLKDQINQADLLRRPKWRLRVDPREISCIDKCSCCFMIPVWLKIVYTLFVCVLVPIYWRQYGRANFLWFSDLALLMMVPALWLENALLASMMAVSVVLLELLWNIDFFIRLTSGHTLTALSTYMFDPKIPLFIRSLSFFHIGLPLLLIWTVHRLGYDRRAWLWQTVVALIVFPLSYWCSNPRENINWAYGFGQTPQTILPASVFVVLLMLLFPILVYLPSHLLFSTIFHAARS